jgi:hypothetical protein
MHTRHVPSETRNISIALFEGCARALPALTGVQVSYLQFKYPFSLNYGISTSDLSWLGLD